MRSSAARAVAIGAVAASTLAAAAAATDVAAATPSTTLVVSEVYGGGGNSGAEFTNDFIELFNAGSSAVDLSGWSVQYHPATSPGSWQATGLTGTIPGGGHYLVQEAKGNGGTTPLPTPDDSGTIAMSGSSGTVALAHTTSDLSCQSGAECAPDVVDLVGYGSAAIYEGSGAAPGLSNSTSAQRAASGADTDNNAADFTQAAPTPQNSGTGGGGGNQPGPAIHDLQGDGWVSPYGGQSVSNVAGVVTAVRTSGSRGFWMQDENPDGDANTSEGIFVYTGKAPTVSPGDSVLVSGKVSDYYPGSDNSNLSVTEISSPTIETQSTENPLPAPIVLGPDTVPDRYAPDLGGRNIEDTPLTPSRSALDYYESIEGMRVEVDNARVVGPSNSYGEQYVTTKPGQARTYRGGTELLGDNKIPSGRLEIAEPDGSQLGLDVGDVLQGATVGAIDWSPYGGYVLEAATLGAVVHNQLPKVVAKPGGVNQLSIATYNVENLAPGDSAEKYQALAEGVVHNLAAPDIVALEEIQDNNGAQNDSVVAANLTLDKLVAAIADAGGPQYQWREVDPVDDQDGGQPGGNIRNAFLFDPARVSFVDRGAQTVDRSTTGTQVVGKNRHTSLSLSPGRIDPQNPVWTDSRKPLVGQFRFHRHDVFVIANHFDSKGGDQNADGRFQYPQQQSRVQRAGQAQVVHDFVQRLLAADKKAEVAVVGDLNDYQFSPPLAALETGSSDGSGSPILTDLITTLPVDQQYTYVYNGISQVLDHILVSPAITHFGYQVVHVNAEYSDQISDHDPQVVDFTP